MRRLFLLPVLMTVAAPTSAQMPDLRSMSGRPLPVADLPVGTVVLRVVRGSVTDPVVGAEVITTIRTAAGEARSGSGKTGPDGRVTFEGLPFGGEFEATVTVDGERLDTARFSLPRTGGIRVMLIAGLGPPDPAGAGGAAAHGEAGGAEPTFRMGATTGTVAPAADLPAGTLEINLRDDAGKPVAGRKVQLAVVKLKAGETGGQGDREVGLQEGTTDADGRVRFTALIIGETAGYAAVAEHDGLRLGTQPFRMPAESGLRGQIVALRRATDPRVLSLDPRTKIIVDRLEDAIQIMFALMLRNTSGEIFDPGEEGLFFPLPDGAVGAQELEGSEPIEITAGEGVRFKSTIPPDSAATFVTQVRFGYVLPADGASSLELRQVLPVTLPDPYILVPAKTGLTLEGSGLKPLKAQADKQGEKIYAYTMPPVGAGGTLDLRVLGIPARDRTGRTVAGVLSLLLLGAAAVFTAFRPGGAAGVKLASEHDSLTERREKLFQELVAIEQQRQGVEGASRDGSSGRLAERRRELVTRLESVYRDLFKLEQSASF
jgi:hypothetical protein